MPDRPATCVHSCKEMCNGLEYASETEKEAILKYAYFRDVCTYPDVRNILNEVILHKKKSIELLEKTKELLKGKFEVLDRIRESFNSES